MTKRAGLCLALIALVAVAFWPAFRAGFVNWDDDRNFLTNVHYRGLDIEHLGWMFTTFHMGPYQPLAWVTLGLDHALYGMDARGYHVTNVAWHAATAVLFFFLARALFECVRPEWTSRMRDGSAFLAALLFGVHPLRVESVAWITERRDVVSGAFFVGTALAWVVYARSTDNRRRKYLTALALFVLALLSKASVVTLPFVFIVLDAWPLRRLGGDTKRLVLEKLPFLALSALFAVIAVAGQRATGTALRALDDHGPERRIAQAAYAAVFHTWKTLWPSGLSPIYDMPSPFVASEPRFVASIVAVIAMCALAWFARKRIPAWSASWFAFLLLLAPVSGLVAVGPQLVADRYSYLACMPYALLAAGAAGIAFETQARRTLAIGAALVVCTALVVATRKQTAHWHDSTSLWERAVAVDPQSAVALDHLGVVRVTQSQSPHLDAADRMRLLDEALDCYRRAYEIAPHPLHLFNMGGALTECATLFKDPVKQREELELAEETMRQGLDFASRTSGVDPRWRVMYAAVLVQLKRYTPAEEQLALVLRANPDQIGALQWSARIHFEHARNEEALTLLYRTTEIDPENVAAWTILANSLQALGKTDEAERARARARAGR
jgi:tetratricopeptide (TPR) repeat protein